MPIAIEIKEGDAIVILKEWPNTSERPDTDRGYRKGTICLIDFIKKDDAIWVRPWNTKACRFNPETIYLGQPEDLGSRFQLLHAHHPFGAINNPHFHRGCAT